MISVLLTLLKIIGIVILSLLGLFLFLLLIVLFVPVKYRLKGYYKDEFVCHGKATWLLHLLSVSFDYDKEFHTAIRIFGIDISSLIKQKEKNSSPKNKKKSQNESSIDNTSDKNSSISKSTIETTGQETVTDPIPEDDIISDSIQDEASDSSKSIFKKIKAKILSLYNKLLELIDTAKQIVTNLITKKESLERYIRILQREEVKNTFSVCKKRIFKMIRYFLPKNMKIHAHIGMEDPATTGYILAVYSVLSDKFRRQIILKADFEEVIMECDYIVKGSCNAFGFLFQLLGIITNKNSWTFYKLVKKEISNERK